MEVERLDFGKVFDEVTLGNPAAKEFCHAFLAWVHHIDDMIDGDKPDASPEQIVRLHIEVAIIFAFNPFWQLHKKSLLPLVVQGFQAFADSMTVEQWRAQDVLKSQYAEVFWHIAFICGGWEHLQQVTGKYRRFDYEAVA